MKSEDEEKWFLLVSKLQGQRIRKAFEIFRNNGIEPILLKGYSIARYYPEDRIRDYVDIDLAVSPGDYQRALALTKTEEMNPLYIDLHNGFRHLDIISWEKILDNSELIDIENSKIRTLSAEDHLRVLSVHWLTDGGARKDRLWDIFYLVKNKNRKFDWEKCFDGIDDKRKYWIICTIGIAHKYIGLDIEETPFAEEAKELPKWIHPALEKIWKREYPLMTIASSFYDTKQLMHQIKYRFPPNPITSTICVEGRLNSKTRIFYQIRYFLQRLIPSLKSIIKTHLFK